MTDTPKKTPITGNVKDTSPHRLITGFNPKAHKAPSFRRKKDSEVKCGPNGVPLITTYYGLDNE